MSRLSIPSHRQAEILRRLEGKGSVSVSELAEQFQVAGETIRRDFDKLAELGRLVRTHGGAVAPGTPGIEPTLVERLAANAPAKQAIAEQAITRLLTEDFFSVSDPVLALDASSTALEFARRLPNRSMTVISNGLDIVRLLGDRPRIRAIATGGEFDPRGACFVGTIAEATLRKFAIHIACFSCRSVERQRGCSEASPDHASFKRLLLDISDRKALLVDQSKLNQRSVAFFAQIEEIDEIITDAPGSDPDYAWLTQHTPAHDLKS